MQPGERSDPRARSCPCFTPDVLDRQPVLQFTTGRSRRVGDARKRLYACLVRLSRAGRCCSTATQSLADRLGKSERQIQQYIEDLVRLGLIAIDWDGSVVFLWHPAFAVSRRPTA